MKLFNEIESEVSGNLPNNSKSPKRKKIRPENSKSVAFINSHKTLVPDSNKQYPEIQSLLRRNEVPDRISDREHQMLGIEVITGKKTPDGKSFSGRNLRKSKSVHFIYRSQE